LASDYDDELWRRVPVDPGPPPAHLTRFVDSLGPAADTLDLGSGDGRLSADLRAERLTIADVSRVALERAARRLPESTAVELSPDAPLPLPDTSFDLALCAETIEHVRDVQLLLSELRRVLRPGATLAITTPAHGRATALRALATGFDRVFDPRSPHLRRFTRRSLATFLDEMGFDVVSARRERRTLMMVATR
jgi:ubiquinone/menaquinone biosynthesis C-methylase UbiE